MISSHITTKTPEEVEEYSKVFFAKIETLADCKKIQANIEKAERVISFRTKAPEIIKQKIMAYESPIDQMVIYATQKSKYFSRDSDIILLCLTNKHGYGHWQEIKKAIRRDSRCRFDHLFLSRNEQELSRRVDILVKALEKEETSASKGVLKTIEELEMIENQYNVYDDGEDESSEQKSTIKAVKSKPKKVKKPIKEEDQSNEAPVLDEEELRMRQFKDQLNFGGRPMSSDEEEDQQRKKKRKEEFKAIAKKK